MNTPKLTLRERMRSVRQDKYLRVYLNTFNKGQVKSPSFNNRCYNVMYLFRVFIIMKVSNKIQGINVNKLVGL